MDPLDVKQSFVKVKEIPKKSITLFVHFAPAKKSITLFDVIVEEVFSICEV